MDNLSLHQYFQSGAVLQRDAEFRISGRATAGAVVEIQWHELGLDLQVEADSAGRWKLTCSSQPAGGPHNLEIRSGIERISLRDLYFGDVFILAGQSNMELPLNRCMDKMEEAFRSFSDPLIREIKPLLQCRFDQPAEDWLGGSSWLPADAEHKGQLTALGLSFARRYREEHNVAVGLVNIAVGGSPIESWLPSTYEGIDPALRRESLLFSDDDCRRATIEKEQAAVSAWYEKMGVESMPDSNAQWQACSFPQMFLGTEWESYIGSLWLRRRFHLTAADLERLEGAKLYFGTLIDADRIYINGAVVGETGYRYPPRRYPLPDGLLREGENEIVLRLVIHTGRGGAVPSRFYGLKSAEERLSLAGEWEMLAGRSAEALPATTNPQYLPWSLYNGMLMPVHDFPITASLWYQGEGNDRRPESYEQLFRDFIAIWKQLFGEDKAFIYCQLSQYEDPTKEILPAAWSIIRQAQARVADTPSTAMVVTYDCGELDDLHPQDKWTVGLRAHEALERIRNQEHGAIVVGPLPEENEKA